MLASLPAIMYNDPETYPVLYSTGALERVAPLVSEGNIFADVLRTCRRRHQHKNMDQAASGELNLPTLLKARNLPIRTTQPNLRVG